MNHRVYRKILKNNMRVLMIQSESVDTVSVGIYVKVGSRYETEENNGISHFLEHMMFKGSKNYPGNMICEMLDNVGAKYNAETSHEMTCYYINGHKNDLELFIKIITDIYSNSLFRDDDIITERGVVLEELNMSKDDNTDMMYDCLHENIFTNSSLKYPILGNKKTISSFTHKQLMSYVKKFYVPERTVFVISGSFKKDKVFPILEKKLGKIPNGTHDIIIPIQDPPIQIKPVIIQKEIKDISQTQIIICFRSHSIYSIYSPVYDIIADVLSSGSSSRLFELLRNKLGITYHSEAENLSYTYEGIFTIHMAVDNKRVDEAIKKVLDALKNLLTKGITKEELEKSKRIRITAFSLGLQSPMEILSYYGTQEIIYQTGTVPTEYRKRISVKDAIDSYQSVTLDVVNKLMKNLFTPEKLNIFIYGHPSKITDDIWNE
jgi:predicted Zn-dependent peptidase